jgi:hypothetical protein
MITTRGRESGVALTITLVLLSLVVIVVVAYLVSTRIERSTSAVHANRLRAKIVADAGLTAAIHLLRDNTRYGNYITAMQAPSPSPVSLYTEIYRPADPVDPNHGVKADDYLRFDNASGDVLVSRAIVGSSAGADPRPTPEAIPSPLASASPFTISSPVPALSEERLPPQGSSAPTGNSYNFNQIVRLGPNSSGRLVQPSPSPSPLPALGQWVNVRNSGGELIGRYAFYVEDESMKVNLNASGNNLGAGNSHLRINDLTALPTSSPTAQVQEIYPAAVLPPTSNRSTGMTQLAAIGPIGARLSSRSSIAFQAEWQSAFPDYAQSVTAISNDDNTTSRGWKRLNLNKVVANAAGTPTAKQDAAKTISNWIRDAWTGFIPITPLSTDPTDGRHYQMYDEERLRLQLAANIVDYIDADNLPTDLGDIKPADDLTAVPVIGIEKIPYLSTVIVIYQAEDRALVTGSSPARETAKISVKFRFNFINLYDQTLDLKMTNPDGSRVFDKIEVKGIPTVTKLSEVVFNKSDLISIPIDQLKPVKGAASDFTVPPGTDGTSTSGVRTFESPWMVTKEPVSFRAATGNPIFSPVGQMTVSVLGPSNARLDVTAMTWSDTPDTGFRQSGTTKPGTDSVGDFLRDEPAGAIPGVPRGVTATFNQETLTGSGSGSVTRLFGDPRYHPMIPNDRWRRENRTDTESAFGASALDAETDSITIQNRTAGFDWYDDVGDRPLAFLRNGPMLNVAELGNAAASEYPWRTLYFQHPDRPIHSTTAIVQTEVANQRRMGSLDFILADLFKTSDEDNRPGSININSSIEVDGSRRVLESLFLNLLAGDKAVTQKSVSSATAGLIATTTGSALATALSERRIIGNPITPDNAPIHPFLRIGELAPVLSRLFSASKRVAGESRSTVTYSVLRTSPADTTQFDANFRSDINVEQPFREVSGSITTRGNVFRILYVGQSIRDVDHNGAVNSSSEISAEFLGEAFVERKASYKAPSSNGATPNVNALTTSDSTYKILSQRLITE